MSATISSHILDTVSGTSAAGIRIELFRIENAKRISVFDVTASDEGRIVKQISGDRGEYELVFHGADYFARQPDAVIGQSVLRVVVLRFNLTNPEGRYHMPIMLSPHSYSVWWAAQETATPHTEGQT